MWRMRVVHSTGYAYKSPVTASFNEARLTPRSDSRQNVILNRVETVPATRSYRYVDYWGTAVTSFDLHAPHTELEVTSSSVVETDKRRAARGEGQLGRPELGGGDRPVRRDAQPDRLRAGEQAHSGGGQTDRQVQRSARRRSRRRAVGAQRTRVRAGHHRRALVGARRAPRGQGRLPGLRASDADSVARHGNSGAIRVGLSASRTREATVGDTIDGQSHAWIQAWTGGWWNYDPTNDADINEQYISVGVGRDYSDVSPLKGVYSGEGSTDLDVVVEITRLA